MHLNVSERMFVDSISSSYLYLSYSVVKHEVVIKLPLKKMKVLKRYININQ